MQAFGVTESQMDKAAEMLVRSESTENSGEFASLTSQGQ